MSNYNTEINIFKKEKVFFLILYFSLIVSLLFGEDSTGGAVVDFNKRRLIKTDEIISSNLIKERVLRFHAIGFLLQKQHDSINKSFLETFNKVSKNKLINKEIFNLYEKLKG